MWSARYLAGASLPALIQAACTEKQRGQLLAAFTPPVSAIELLSEMKLVLLSGDGWARFRMASAFTSHPLN